MSKRNTIFRDRWGDLRIGWVFLIALYLVLLALGGIVAGCIALDRHVCQERTAALNLDGTWGVWSGCIVNVDGNPIPLDQYFVNQESGA